MNIKLILQGFIVGVGKIIPGVSGAMLAMLMGIYEDLMEAVTKFFDNKKKNFSLLLNFGLGLFLAIVLFSKIILFLLNNYYEETIYLFLGLIMGTIFHFKKSVNLRGKNKFIFIFTLLLMFILPFWQNQEMFIFQNNFIHYLYVVFLGIIDAITSIVPGISGTAIFMMIGTYQFVLTILSNPGSFLFIVYLLGVVIGAILTCLIMYYLLKKWKTETNVVIFAFSLNSLFILFLNVCNVINLFLIILFVFGIIIGYIFDQ